MRSQAGKKEWRVLGLALFSGFFKPGRKHPSVQTEKLSSSTLLLAEAKVRGAVRLVLSLAVWTSWFAFKR